ncbi:MAG TPA: PD-(D/E)XK nuclease family protein [Dehalococcoidia bacterium]|nr:PD-(D/E)XK nuclease family protein [Dehalococcoidia bacterium]
MSDSPPLDIEAALDAIARGRAADPLAPVTVIAPSHVAALQLRRRLAERAPFAGVRFETLPRLAELIAAGRLAAEGRRPLARPIADYLAAEVAREAEAPFRQIRDLPGFATTLRAVFRRLRAGDIRNPDDVAVRDNPLALKEALRLFGRFLERTAPFYDADDLYDAAAAAILEGSSAVAAELGAVYALPPAARSAGADALIAAIGERAPTFIRVQDAPARAEMRFVLAPDPASEAREVAREVLAALEEGVALHEIAVFHGADHTYPRLLREALDAAGVPAAPSPGVPLIETAAGRGVIALLALPSSDYSRVAVMDFFTVAPLRDRIPSSDGDQFVLPHVWDRVSRDAGVTRGRERWPERLETHSRLLDDILASPDTQERERYARRLEFERDQADALRGVVERLAARLDTLSSSLPARRFIEEFSAIVREYFRPDAPGLPEVVDAIEQLGTIDAVDGRFDLDTFARMLRVNLEAAYTREIRFGEGVLIADYRAAAGLRFRRVILCGAYEGVLPAGPGPDPLLDDAVWSRLREGHPFIEDRAARLQQAREAADRAIASASELLVWTCPLYEPGGTREFYPSPLMVAYARQRDAGLATASDLRQASSRDGWLRRGASTLTLALRGPVIDEGELSLRQSVLLRRSGRDVDAGHRLWRPVTMLRARRSADFTEWDGNLRSLGDPAWLRAPDPTSPTALERYARCGFQFLCHTLLGLRSIEEPEDRDLMDPLTRGDLMHRVLQRFFEELRGAGRPRAREPWTGEDRSRLLAILDEELDAVRKRGQTGLDVYGAHEARTLATDLQAFLDEDEAFRAATGAVPCAFEAPLPETDIGGLRLRGFVDRIDRADDGRAWVIDYKTGKPVSYRDVKPDRPFGDGTKLQLAAYALAIPDAPVVEAIYWFITHAGNFERIRVAVTPQVRQRLQTIVRAIGAGIAQGAFPAVPAPEGKSGWEHCQWCEFDRICSRRRDDEFEEKRGHADFRAWLAVGEAARGDGS